MFSHAIEVASAFTFPFVGLRRDRAGRVHTTVAAFVVVNPEGWVLTSAHVANEFVVPDDAGSGTPGAHGDEVVSRSEIWAIPGFSDTPSRVVEVHVNRLADIALCRLEPFFPERIETYPVFRSAENPVLQGMSVCRLGFPFYDVEASWEDAGEGFVVDSAAFPAPRFALDGIVARFHRIWAEPNGASALFIETSTPGLRGQSGGPLVDVEGRVCGIQSHTSQLDLGFDAHYESDGRHVVERQFLNVGAATHVDEVRMILGGTGVGYFED